MNIIVTGASKGIGYETVKKLCVDDAHNIIAIARSKEGLTKLQQECRKKNSACRLTIIDFDLSSKLLEKELIPKILQQFGTVDVLINNAAILVNKKFRDISDEELENVYNSNVFALFRLKFVPVHGKSV
jgi:short-subunit dehydrogenase